LHKSRHWCLVFHWTFHWWKVAVTRLENPWSHLSWNFRKSSYNDPQIYFLHTAIPYHTRISEFSNIIFVSGFNSTRWCLLVYVSKNVIFSAVWSAHGVVYFYYTLWHTNWPNVFLWRINYWLSDTRMLKLCFKVFDRLMFSGWCRVNKLSSFGIFHSTIFDTLNLTSGLFSSSTKTRIFIAIDKHWMRYDAQTWKLTFNIIEE
jgi:hypothetical protein